MKASAFLCLGSTEVSNDARVQAYVEANGITGVTMGDCACAAYDEGYTNVIGEAPWYEPTRSESLDFMGFRADAINLLPTYGRRVTQVGRKGSQIGPLTTKGQIVSVAGTLWATSSDGMSYGERWLREVLKGSPCNGEGCPGDDLIYLPSCPEDDGYDADSRFRTLVNVGIVDGPVFSQVQELPECHIQQAVFTLVSSSPWTYHPTVRCLDAINLGEFYGDPLDCSLTTPDWMGHGTFIIDIASIDTADVTDITITGRLSPEGNCDENSIPPSFVYNIPILEPEDRVVIDGMRGQVLLYDASEKVSRPGLPLFDWSGPWIFPDVPPCSTMCITVSGSGDAEVTVDSVLRES